jgi:homoserine O-succinyltransferase
LVASKDRKHIFMMGHAEYDGDTLAKEYARDREKKGDQAPFPLHYFEDDDPTKAPIVRWRGHAHLLFSNWLNYYVYQTTPYRLEDI